MSQETAPFRAKGSGGSRRTRLLPAVHRGGVRLLGLRVRDCMHLCGIAGGDVSCRVPRIRRALHRVRSSRRTNARCQGRPACRAPRRPRGATCRAPGETLPHIGSRHRRSVGAVPANRTLKLTALRRPFLYFPLEGRHLEQNHIVAEGLARHGAGQRCAYSHTIEVGPPSSSRLGDDRSASPEGALPHGSPLGAPDAVRSRRDLSLETARIAVRVGSGTHREECLNPTGIRGNPGLSARSGRFEPVREGPANRSLLRLELVRGSLDRTQEVAGSSPASSISRSRCTWPTSARGGSA